jgi:hypothetical protein
MKLLNCAKGRYLYLVQDKSFRVELKRRRVEVQSLYCQLELGP